MWTADFARSMAGYDRFADIHTIGPILWYQPSPGQQKADGIALAAFDLPALSDEFARSVGQLTNFLTIENLKAFIDDLIRLRVTLQKEYPCPVQLILKQKRYHSVNYEREYTDYVESCYATNQLELMPATENMFDMIESSHVAIVFPYSSPAYVASFLGVTAIFHDPTRTLAPAYVPEEEIWFSSGFDDLLAKCKTALVAGVDDSNRV